MKQGYFNYIRYEMFVDFFPNGSVCTNTFETIWFEYRVAHLVVVVRVFFDGHSFVFGDILFCIDTHVLI